MAAPMIPGRDTPDPELTYPTVEDQAAALHEAMFERQTQQDRNRGLRIYGTPEPTLLAPVQPAMSRTRIVNGFPVPDINPEAFDPNNYMAGTDVSQLEPQLQSLLERLDIFQIVAQQSLGVGEADARTIARRLEAMSAEQPWVRDLIFDDFQTAAMLTEADALAARFLPGFNMSDQMLRVVADQISEEKSRYTTVKAFEFAQETIDRGSWLTDEIEAGDLTRQVAYTNPDPKHYSRVDPNQTFNAKAAGFIERIQHEEVQSIRTTYDQDANRLVATVAYIDGEEVSIDVRLDEGTEITDDNALEEIFLAQQGFAHEVASAGELRGPQTMLGRGFEIAGNVGEAYDVVNAPVNMLVGAIGWSLDKVLPTYEGEEYVLDWRSSYWQHQEQNRNELDRMVSAVRDEWQREDTLRVVADMLTAEYGPDQAVLAASQSIGWVDGMDDESHAEFTNEILDEEALRDEFERQLDDRSTLKRSLDSTIEGAAWLGTAYDQTLHWLGIFCRPA